MIGNVWAWVNDWYSDTYYASSPTNNPTGPETGAYRVLRGGSWYHNFDYLRASSRGSSNPGGSSDDLGFRCAK